MTVDFSQNAHVYDDRHGTHIDAALAGKLVRALGVAEGARVLDAAAGTGRVAVPLTQAGLTMIGLDLARPMLQQLRAKANGGPCNVLQGDTMHLPFSAASFDAVVFARLLYLLPAWRDFLDEAVRVARRPVRLAHEWGNGTAAEPWAQVRDWARALFEAEGVTQPFHPGVRSEADVEAYLAQAHGLRPAACIAQVSRVEMTLGAFIDRLERGVCSYIWNVPEPVQARCLPRLRARAEAQFDLDAPMRLPAEERWVVYAQ